jgi:regulator of protease activity HflC (stomatin/prohibitin superfamily)
MGIIILLLILAVITAGGIIAMLMKEPRYIGACVAGGGLALLVLTLLVTSLTAVGPSDTGIVTAFGHTQGGDLRPGMHLVAPWDAVTTWDGSVQSDSYAGSGCLTIRIAGSQSACLDVKVQWKDNPAAADAQFKAYRTFSRMADGTMSRIAIEGFFNNVFEAFDPVREASLTAAGETSGSTVTSLTRQVTTQMQAAYRGEITIVSLASGNIRYDSQVETALSSVVTAKAKTNVAVQGEQTAEAQKAAANDLAGARLTPAVLYQTCLNDTLEMTSPSEAWNCGSVPSLSLLLNGSGS